MNREEFKPTDVTNPDDLSDTMGLAELEWIAAKILAFLISDKPGWEYYTPKTPWDKPFSCGLGRGDQNEYDWVSFASRGYITHLRYNMFLVTQEYIDVLYRRERRLRMMPPVETAAHPKDFETALRRLVRAVKSGDPAKITSRTEMAADLLRRKGTISLLREV